MSAADVEPEDSGAPNERGEVAVWLTPDEVLVLGEWCTRMERNGDYEGLVDHEAERVALWNLNCVFERIEPYIFASDYREKLAAARERLASGYVSTEIEGDATPS